MVFTLILLPQMIIAFLSVIISLMRVFHDYFASLLIYNRMIMKDIFFHFLMKFIGILGGIFCEEPTHFCNRFNHNSEEVKISLFF